MLPTENFTAKHYLECHVTIEPVFDEDLESVKVIAENHGFKVPHLLMKKRKADTETRSKHDTFMTSHSKELEDIHNRMVSVIQELQKYNFEVWRYKIEDIICDSRYGDYLDVCDGSPEPVYKSGSPV